MLLLFGVGHAPTTSPTTPHSPVLTLPPCPHWSLSHGINRGKLCRETPPSLSLITSHHFAICHFFSFPFSLPLVATRLLALYEPLALHCVTRCQAVSRLIRWVHVLILDAPTLKGLRCTCARGWFLMRPLHTYPVSIAGEVRLSPSGEPPPVGAVTPKRWPMADLRTALD